MDDFLALLDQWNQEDEYQKIIDCLETLSNTQTLDYTLTCQLARAYNNIADLDKPEAEAQLERAEELVRLTGIRTLRFCHNNRFLVAADTKEDARAACLLALRLAEERKVRE